MKEISISKILPKFIFNAMEIEISSDFFKTKNRL